MYRSTRLSGASIHFSFVTPAKLNSSSSGGSAFDDKLTASLKFECEYVQTIRIPTGDPVSTVDIVIGRVAQVHIDISTVDTGSPVGIRIV
jgi:flavin reductase (DIM6/NTAB) family NADH-FMN oxidoreductase RutF